MTSAGRDIPPLDLAAIDWATQRYETYRRYRTHDPVHRGAERKGRPCWYLFRHEDVTRLLADTRLVREDPAQPLEAPMRRSPGLFELDDLWLINRDAPAHTADRQWIARSLSTDSMATLASRTSAQLDVLLDALPERFDFVSSVAQRLPARLLLGLIGFDDTTRLDETVVAMLRTGATVAGATAARVALAGELRVLHDERRATPRDDFLSRLITTRPDASATAVISACLFLLTTGYGGVVSLLSASALCVAGHESARERHIVRRVLDETLRLESPIQMVDRWVAEDLDVDGRRLARGDRVYLVIGSANRDPDRFASPDAFDPAREGSGHIAFGAATHACLGSGFAASVGQAAVARLAERALRLDGPVEWCGEPFIRELVSLPMRG